MRTPIFKPVLGNHFIRGIDLDVHGEHIKVLDAILWEQAIHTPKFRYRIVTVRFRVGGVPLEADLFFYSGDPKETLWINDLARMLSTLRREPNRSC